MLLTDLIIEHYVLVLIHFVLFSSIILDRFKVQQRIHGTGLQLVVLLVHLPFVLCPPLRHRDCPAFVSNAIIKNG